MSERYIVVLANANGQVLESASMIAAKVTAIVSGNTRKAGTNRSGKRQLPKLSPRATEAIGAVTEKVIVEQKTDIDVLTGGSSGAVLGATIGAPFGGPVGAAIGGTIGAVGGALYGLFD